ncbi:pentapeptide repeat-containing protein, partial [Kitasatospora sp. NPDC101447]|uniref:pentapeptide repeat-containing protein n=1 Tax=Kitasatospora sp. NPDC101447 TaxID=3364102 RepID=UPI00382D871D
MDPQDMEFIDALTGSPGATWLLPVATVLAAVLVFWGTSRTLKHQRLRTLDERFATAAEKLGHNQAAVRMAGVYAMASLADDWEEQRQTCIDVLCSYLRLPCLRSLSGLQEGEREVRLSIIRTITSHLRENAKTTWCGYHFDFTEAVIDGGNFKEARFTDGTTVIFHGAKFTGGETRFDRAEFGKCSIDFSGAAFIDGQVTFERATIKGG